MMRSWDGVGESSVECGVEGEESWLQSGSGISQIDIANSS